MLRAIIIELAGRHGAAVSVDPLSECIYSRRSTKCVTVALALIAALSRNPVPKKYDGFALNPIGVVAAHFDGLLPLLRSGPITLLNGVLSDNDRNTGVIGNCR